MERPAWMAGEPSLHLGMLVGGIVVKDGVDGLSLRHLRFDGVEEPDKLLMPMALHVATDNGAIKHVEGSKQRGGAMPLVIMRHGAGASRFHRQSRLSAVQRLDLAFFVDR